MRLPASIELECPFAWAGIYACPAGAHVFDMMPGPDRTMSVVLLRITGERCVFFNDLARSALLLFGTSPLERAPGHVVLPGELHQQLVLDGPDLMQFPVLLPRAGRYALFTQHPPAKFRMSFIGSRLCNERVFEAAHALDANRRPGVPAI